MSYDMQMRAGAIAGGKDLTTNFTATSEARMGVEETVAGDATDKQIAFDLDISALVAIVLVSDQDLTIETNDGTTPDDTINLSGGVPRMYASSPAFGTNPFSADITDIYASNNTGEEATLQIEAIYDPTP